MRLMAILSAALMITATTSTDSSAADSKGRTQVAQQKSRITQQKSTVANTQTRATQPRRVAQAEQAAEGTTADAATTEAAPKAAHGTTPHDPRTCPNCQRRMRQQQASRRSSRRSNGGFFSGIMEFERRKNAWLRGLFR